MSYRNPRGLTIAPFTGDSTNRAAAAVTRKTSLVSEGGRSRVKDDLERVSMSIGAGGAIIVALTEYDNELELRGSLPISVDGDIGVLHTILVDGSRGTREIRSGIGREIIGAALSYLVTLEDVNRVRVEAPLHLTGFYNTSGLAIGSTVDLKVIQPTAPNPDQNYA